MPVTRSKLDNERAFGEADALLQAPAKMNFAKLLDETSDLLQKYGTYRLIDVIWHA
jgi:hypothetical protein